MYGTLLGFLFEEAAVCDDSTLRTVLIIGAIVFTLKLLIKLIAKSLEYCKDDVADHGVDFEDGPNHHNPSLIERILRLVVALPYVALNIFLAVTMTRLAIPESYTAVCANSGLKSRFILHALVASAIATIAISTKNLFVVQIFGSLTDSSLQVWYYLRCCKP